MEHFQHKITIRELVEAYQNNDEDGVFAYGGKLIVRPAYQREFVYNNQQQVKVIESIMLNRPLSTMYWFDNENGQYEIIDGQQRTMSICEFYANNLYFGKRVFNNFTEAEKKKFLNYGKLCIEVCKGDDLEKLDWFKTINIAGVALKDQELINAVYTGTWLTNAKRYFSKTGCPAYQIASKYIKGSPIQQDYLETALNWISGGDLQTYMSQHQHDKDASELWVYFQNVINWVKVTFPDYYSEMKSVDWGSLYAVAKASNKFFNPNDMQEKVKMLMQDEDVTKKSGIFAYLITDNQKHLNIRTFDQKTKREVYQRQAGVCCCCGNAFDIEEMEADHITPWSKGGSTSKDNCQLLCVACNRRKSSK